MSVEQIRITILESENWWSDRCSTALEQAGLSPTRQDPDIAHLNQEGVKDNLFLIRVPGSRSERLNLARKVCELGGMSLIMASSEEGYVAMDCMTIGRTAFLGHENAFSRLIEVARAISSQREPNST